MRIFDKVFKVFNRKGNKLKYNLEVNKWDIIEGQNNKNPMIIRKLNQTDSIIGNSEYSINCGIAFKLLFPNENGLPEIEKEPELYDLEDFLIELFNDVNNTIIVGIITTSGFKEFVFYVKNQEVFYKKLYKLRMKYNQYIFTEYCRFDPSWDNYYSLENLFD